MKHDPLPQAQTLVQRALSGHAALGLLAGAMMYWIALSGMLVVIHERWQRWEEPAVAESMGIAPQAVQAAANAAFAADRAAGKPATTHLYVHMPTADLPRTVVTTDHGAVYVDRAGRIVGPEGHAWTEFLVNLHIYLHLPMVAGLIVVGALGAMLAALAITGVVAHPRIFRDAFRLRARGNRQVAQADWHNRLGVWTLPFILALALTGAIIGLAQLNGMTLAKAYHNGDIEAVYAPIFGGEARPDEAAAPLADVVTALSTMQARFPGATPSYVTIHDPGTRGQHVQILADHPRRLIYGETYQFDGAGRFHGRVGLSDGPLGQQAAASIYKLHFGSFGGLPVELAYLALGLALCVVTGTGMSLWLQKRRRRGLPSPRLEAFWVATLWLTPVLIVAMLWLRWIAGHEAPLVPAFWIALAAGTIAAMVAPRLADPRRLRMILAVMIALTAVGHLALGGARVPALAMIDLALLATAAVLARFGRAPRPAA